MISPEYCVMMARYNQWQNNGVRKLVKGMSAAELTEDRGAFFGSILGTLNHLLWGDTIWMSRFDGGAAPEGGIPTSAALTASAAEWDRLRFGMDGRILEWAKGLGAIDLTGDFPFYSGSLGRNVAPKKAVCISHFFNHQTHHRGQVHAMMTAAGQKPNDTDLFIMPEA